MALPLSISEINKIYLLTLFFLDRLTQYRNTSSLSPSLMNKAMTNFFLDIAETGEYSSVMRIKSTVHGAVACLHSPSIFRRDVRLIDALYPQFKKCWGGRIIPRSLSEKELSEILSHGQITLADDLANLYSLLSPEELNVLANRRIEDVCTYVVNQMRIWSKKYSRLASLLRDINSPKYITVDTRQIIEEITMELSLTKNRTEKIIRDYLEELPRIKMKLVFIRLNILKLESIAKMIEKNIVIEDSGYLRKADESVEMMKEQYSVLEQKLEIIKYYEERSIADSSSFVALYGSSAANYVDVVSLIERQKFRKLTGLLKVTHDLCNGVIIFDNGAIIDGYDVFNEELLVRDEDGSYLLERCKAKPGKVDVYQVQRETLQMLVETLREGFIEGVPDSLRKIFNET